MHYVENIFEPFSLGQTRRKVELNGLIVTDTTHSPNQKLSRHRHELANVLFVLKGAFNETIDGKTQTCGPLSLFIRPRGELHSNEYDTTGTRCLILGLEPDWHESLIKRPGLLDRPSFHRGAQIAGLGLKLRRELSIADSASNMSIEGLVLELFAHVMRQSGLNHGSRRPKWLGQARDFLHEHFAEDLSLVRVAEVAGVHPVHLARTFKTFYKCTIGEYVRNLRIDFAERELAFGESSLVDIALKAGFCAQSHFSTAFRNRIGISPSEYRSAVQPQKSRITPSELKRK